jgi:hypothetical protein
LSRAQDGFYVIGNFNLLIENETWKTILNKVKKLNQIGAGLYREFRIPKTFISIS